MLNINNSNYSSEKWKPETMQQWHFLQYTSILVFLKDIPNEEQYIYDICYNQVIQKRNTLLHQPTSF